MTPTEGGLMHCIKAYSVNWRSYRFWKAQTPAEWRNRSVFLSAGRRDIELMGALFRIERKRTKEAKSQ